MAEIIGLVILIASFIAMCLAIYRKIPLLAELSLDGIVKREGFIKKINNRVKNNIVPKTTSSSQALLLKILSKIRIFFLKGENKMAHWLNALRQKSVKPELPKKIEPIIEPIKASKKNVFSDNYWEKLKVKRRGKREISAANELNDNNLE